MTLKEAESYNEEDLELEQFLDELEE